MCLDVRPSSGKLASCWDQAAAAAAALTSVSLLCSDKQELLPDDKHSSLESLSVPDSPRPGLA